jgi:hypothetical protein
MGRHPSGALRLVSEACAERAKVLPGRASAVFIESLRPLASDSDLRWVEWRHTGTRRGGVFVGAPDQLEGWNRCERRLSTDSGVGIAAYVVGAFAGTLGAMLSSNRNHRGRRIAVRRASCLARSSVISAI